MPGKHDTEIETDFGRVVIHPGTSYGGADTPLEGRYRNLPEEEKARRRPQRKSGVPAARKFRPPDASDFMDENENPA